MKRPRVIRREAKKGSFGGRERAELQRDGFGENVTSMGGEEVVGGQA